MTLCELVNGIDPMTLSKAAIDVNLATFFEVVTGDDPSVFFEVVKTFKPKVNLFP